jgi:hypothetical protein
LAHRAAHFGGRGQTLTRSLESGRPPRGQRHAAASPARDPVGEIPGSEPDNLLGIARTSSRSAASVRVQDDGRAVSSAPSRVGPRDPLTPRSSMFAGSPHHSLGCQEATRSAAPSASPLSLYPLRT